MMSNLLLYFIFLAFVFTQLLIILVVAFLRLRFFKLRRQHKVLYTKSSSSSSSSSTATIAFFHPNCSGGGGGERVLWKAIESLSDLNQELLEGGEGRGDGNRKDMIQKKSIHAIIYTSDPKTLDYKQGKDELLQKDKLDQHPSFLFEKIIELKISCLFSQMNLFLLSLSLSTKQK